MTHRCLLYYISDRSQFRGGACDQRRELLAKIVEATRAGVDYIQLREKDLSARELTTLAGDALSAMRNTIPQRTENRERKTRLLLNSRTDLALAAGADGVHLRADDLSPNEVRKVLDVSAQRALAIGHFLVAVSCHSNEDVIRAESEAADFAVFAAVFGKQNAPVAQATGIARLREACQAKIPVLALGGVTLQNADTCLKAGAAGIAAIRLFQENRIEEVVRALRSL